MRKLASIQFIKDLQSIPNADRIEVATILGWQCVVKKGEFKIGDKCVYIEIDSLLPEDNPAFDFLKNSKGHIERIRTIKLRGQISQGLALPMTVLKEDYAVGTDVTNVLKIKKWEPDVYNRPRKMKGKASYDVKRFHSKWANLLLYNKPWTNLLKRFIFTSKTKRFPTYITKSDETRVQAIPDVVKCYEGTKCSVTEKLDGQSITVWFDGKKKFHVASRNLEILDHTNYFWTVVQRLDVENKLRSYFKDVSWIALQGELCGPNIQGNKYKFKEKDIYWYNLMFVCLDQQIDYGSQEELNDLCNHTGLKPVPVLKPYVLKNDINELVEMSKGDSIFNDVPREGLVIRPEPPIYDACGIGSMVGNRVSFKVINPEFLLKYKL